MKVMPTVLDTSNRRTTAQAADALLHPPFSILAGASERRTAVAPPEPRAGRGMRPKPLPLLALLGGVLLAAAPLARAAAFYTFPYHSGFANDGEVPDGNANPWSDTRTVDTIPSWHTIVKVEVELTVSGGYNGDLYGYLSHAGTLVPLLNRPGVGTGDSFGYADAGLDVTFTDTAAENIHFYQTVPNYDLSGGAPWQPDGRAVNPVTAAPEDFDAPGTLTLAAFAGLDPNGDWTLALADVSSGGGQATVTRWALSLTTVPEPADWGLAAGGALLLLAAARRRGKRGKGGNPGAFQTVNPR